MSRAKAVLAIALIAMLGAAAGAAFDGLAPGSAHVSAAPSQHVELSKNMKEGVGALGHPNAQTAGLPGATMTLEDALKLLKNGRLADPGEQWNLEGILGAGFTLGQLVLEPPEEPSQSTLYSPVPAAFFGLEPGTGGVMVSLPHGRSNAYGPGFPPSFTLGTAGSDVRAGEQVKASEGYPEEVQWNLSLTKDLGVEARFLGLVPNEALNAVDRFILWRSGLTGTYVRGIDVKASLGLGSLNLSAGFASTEQNIGERWIWVTKKTAAAKFELKGAAIGASLGLEKTEGGAVTRSAGVDLQVDMVPEIVRMILGYRVVQDISREASGGEAAQAQATVGVLGKYDLADKATLTAQYSVTGVRDGTGSKGFAVSTTAQAGLEYRLDESTSLKAGYAVDAGPTSVRETRTFDIGYGLSADAKLSVGYTMVDFSGQAPEKDRNMATAEFVLKF